MRVKVRVAGFIKGKTVNQSFEEEVEEGTTLRDLFKVLDGQKRVGRGYFMGLLTMTNPPSILLNGDRVVVTRDSGILLKEGDEVAVISPLAGGTKGHEDFHME